MLNKNVHFWKDPYSHCFVVASVSIADEMVTYRENEEIQFHVSCNPEFANTKPRDISAKAHGFV